MTAEFKRLGKRGSYRLGELRARGIREPGPPNRLRPWFGRPDHRLPGSVWLALLLLGAAAIAVGALADWWFMPFAAGLAAGVVNRAGNWAVRIALPAVCLMAAAGWGLPLWWSVLAGQPYGAVAREFAATAGLPGVAVVGIAVTVLVAIAQALVGYWLGRALTPRRADF